MKATGIVRRIDELGRVVVPKEIRRNLRMREGDPLEIFTGNDGEVVLKKYSPLGDMATSAKQYAESLAQVLGCTVCVTDRDQIIAASGRASSELIGKDIHKDLQKAIDERVAASTVLGDDYIQICKHDPDSEGQIVQTIISEGDAIGAVVVLSKTAIIGDMISKMALVAASFLGKQMEG